jgi:hypothetical protein
MNDDFERIWKEAIYPNRIIIQFSFGEGVNYKKNAFNTVDVATETGTR